MSLESLYDCTGKNLTAYALDPRGRPLQIAQDILRVNIAFADIDGNPIDGPAARRAMDLKAVPNAGRANLVPNSVFAANSSTLQGVCRFVGIVEVIKVGETLVRDILFRYHGP